MACKRAWLCFLLLAAACSRTHIEAEPRPLEGGTTTDAGDASATLACTITFDAEDYGHTAAIDTCAGDSRRACWDDCENGCRSCGATCVHDAACEARCLRDRDVCKTTHCGGLVYKACRADIVSKWLTNNCDALCGPFKTCITKCSAQSNPSCMDACNAMTTSPCNVFRCDEMLNAVERKTLDPRWKANDCDAVCTRVWQCASKACNQSPGCGENGKMYERCLRQVAGAGASACNLARSWNLCPEP